MLRHCKLIRIVPIHPVELVYHVVLYPNIRCNQIGSFCEPHCNVQNIIQIYPPVLIRSSWQRDGEGYWTEMIDINDDERAKSSSHPEGILRIGWGSILWRVLDRKSYISPGGWPPAFAGQHNHNQGVNFSTIKLTKFIGYQNHLILTQHSLLNCLFYIQTI